MSEILSERFYEVWSTPVVRDWLTETEKKQMKKWTTIKGKTEAEMIKDILVRCGSEVEIIPVLKRAII